MAWKNFLRRILIMLRSYKYTAIDISYWRFLQVTCGGIYSSVDVSFIYKIAQTISCTVRILSTVEKR